MKNILWISFLATWTIPLLAAIRKQHTGKLGVIVPIDEGNKCYQNIDGIDFYYIRLTNKQLYNKMNNFAFQQLNTIILEFNPDIIHVHGTEKNLAQVQNYLTTIPVVISIQGIMMSYKPFAYNFLDLNQLNKHKSLKNVLGIGGTKSLYKLFSNSNRYEADIFSKGKYFIGRTEWDKANVLFRNKNARYFHGEELLREEFYNAANTWSVNNCEKYTILMPSGFNPIKGLHIAIEAMHYLVKYYPKAQLIVPDIVNSRIKNNTLLKRIIGDEYVIYIKNLIKKYKLDNNIQLCQRFDVVKMLTEMQSAHVFLSPSSIDNSPNILGEASMIGVPIVTTPVGGILSIFEDNRSCLLAPAGDAFLMAYKLKQIFDSELLAQKLSRNCKQVAFKRHNIDETAINYLNIYTEILSIQ
jgi:glycosyltransferase involved in cell wall biosynthesis